MRLLVIEDEPRIAEILKSGLRRAGFIVDVVHLCAEAREALALTAYDAAILDLGLPDGDGLKLLTQVRAAHNGVPILILTARDAVEDRVSGLDTGADDYLIKPFATSELVARIKALLRRPGGALGLELRAGNIDFDTGEAGRAGGFHLSATSAPRMRNSGTFDAPTGPCRAEIGFRGKALRD